MTARNIKTIFKKESATYFNTPIGYIFSAFFLLLISFLFFYGLGGNSFWDLKIASLEQFFSWIPILYIIFIPAITMRIWSEEEKSGTLEVLMTLPIKDYEIVIGKFLSAWMFLTVTILCTLLAPLTVRILGDLDFGLVFMGYIGTILLGGAYISIGLIISSLTKDQISAFILTLLACFLMFIMGYQPILKFFGNFLGGIIAFLSLSQHFESFRMGVMDPRDFLFFISFIKIILFLNVFVIRGKR
ncbi:MAG TPA: ABC transporter permease subunit [Leptospiraceae bacterium]|nr:ABC transporter permease subunit [Leptospiraceae bacterium]HMW04797.1 ABC transporter permease subunit [Leptospiraceae bacterium]HMX32814.1 ABC transporter permease subunit [Leptospiraceae bacterium]HMY33535.1 ABC transporter permease subunit [Leptospiraceae bacterium]HMZ66803.1 ABC transporter permease subunit [Leptospiraceae bacterium]